jgi:hypothetical protein
MHLPPVHVAIRAFGGVRPLATALERPHQRVIEWAKPYARGGNDGEFPNPIVIRMVLVCAVSRGLQLTERDVLFGREIPDAEVMQGWHPKADWWQVPTASR